MKKLQVLLATILFFFVVTVPVFAQTSTPVPPSGTQNINPCSDPANASSQILNTLCKPNTNLASVIGKFIIYAFVFGAVIALLYLIWGGFKWITSGGDTKGVEGARNHIIAAIIGLIIIFLAYLILNFVVRILTGSDLQNLTFPSI